MTDVDENGDERLFSKELRDQLAPIKDLTIQEALQSPEFFNRLLDHAKLSEEEKKDFWGKIGEPQFYQDKENY